MYILNVNIKIVASIFWFEIEVISKNLIFGLILGTKNTKNLLKKLKTLTQETWTIKNFKQLL